MRVWWRICVVVRWRRILKVELFQRCKRGLVQDSLKTNDRAAHGLAPPPVVWRYRRTVSRRFVIPSSIPKRTESSSDDSNTRAAHISRWR